MPNEIEIREATRGDVERFYKGPSIYSGRMIVALREGEPIGLAGVIRADKRMVVFTDFNMACGMSKRDILRAWKKLVTIIDKYTLVYAHSTKELPTAMGFAKHFGFEPTGNYTEDSEILVRVKHGTN